MCEGIEQIAKVIQNRAGNQLRPIDCLDIICIIGSIVVAGNVRRSAIIAMGDSDDLQYLTAKNWSQGNIPNWRANSNNSVVCNNIAHLPEEFWKTYEGGSEPYGLINLKLSRSCGRLGETKYKDKDVVVYNPCAEQSLNNYETCVTGKTKIATKNGYFSIEDLVGTEVEVFNGREWSLVKPFLAKKEDRFTRIHFSDGSYLDVNKDHEFMVNDNKVKKTKTKDLKVGDKLPRFELPCEGGVRVENAYTLGAFCGDGFIDVVSGKHTAFLCAAENGKEILKYVDAVKVYKPTDRGENQQIYRAKLNLNGQTALNLRNKQLGLPDQIMSMDKQSALEFLAGYIDTDGNKTNTGSCDNYRIFNTSEQKMRDLQLLCRRAGINHSTLSVMGNKGDKTNYGERNYDLYRLTIPSFDRDWETTVSPSFFVPKY